jgi:hypothetical protein
MSGKDLPMRLHGCNRKLVRQARRMLDQNDLTWYAFYNRGFSLLWNTSRFSGALAKAMVRLAA